MLVTEFTAAGGRGRVRTSRPMFRRCVGLAAAGVRVDGECCSTRRTEEAVSERRKQGSREASASVGPWPCSSWPVGPSLGRRPRPHVDFRHPAECSPAAGRRIPVAVPPRWALERQGYFLGRTRLTSLTGEPALYHGFFLELGWLADAVTGREWRPFQPPNNKHTKESGKSRALNRKPDRGRSIPRVLAVPARKTWYSPFPSVRGALNMPGRIKHVEHVLTMSTDAEDVLNTVRRRRGKY